ncbi:MAG: ParB/RepB/Spo0J family partition protein [Burkholderiaceae bacterium]|nr:ParB/RepB/Spo0J family partition protein [Burkholderiaceae bacterium]
MKEYTADAGAAMEPEVVAAAYVVTPMGEDFAHIPLRQLVASLTNPRTTFNPAKLQELADSIKASGVHQPILVRPLPGARVGDTDRHVAYEIVAGERRFRACQLAGLSTIPAMVRPMADGDVLEVQIIENLQRDDLSELEEAEGYDRLMLHSDLNADQVGAKIGKSRSYVYARLKLLDLSLECKTALREGTIDASRALLIARIPDHKLQIKALEYAAYLTSPGEVVSVRALQVWLQQNVMLPLERAPFQITEARLVEAAGSCKDCPKRTGANPDIFADVLSADICTDPPCYNAKAEAHQLRNLARAEAKGMRLISGSEAKSICYEKSSALKGYSPLSQVRTDAGGERLDNLLGKDFAGAVLIENPWSHELIEAVPTAEAEGVLLARGLVMAVVEPKAKADKAELEIEQLKKSVEREIENRFREEAYNTIAESIRKTPVGASARLLTSQLLRVWLISQLDDRLAADMADDFQMTLQEDQMESQREEAVRLHIRAADSGAIFHAATLHMISEERVLARWKDVTDQTPLFSVVAASQCIDLPQLRARVTKDVKAEISSQIAAIKAQNAAQKPPAPTAPLAQPVDAPVAGAKSPLARPKSAHVPAPKLRLSAQEAKQGIAEAMQGIEAEPVPGSDAPGGDTAQAQTQGQQVISGAPSQGSLGLGFAIGQRVRILPNVSARYSKWIGKEGTISAVMDGGTWDVTFRGRNGGLANFYVSELEVVGS